MTTDAQQREMSHLSNSRIIYLALYNIARLWDGCVKDVCVTCWGCSSLALAVLTTRVEEGVQGEIGSYSGHSHEKFSALYFIFAEAEQESWVRSFFCTCKTALNNIQEYGRRTWIWIWWQTCGSFDPTYFHQSSKIEKGGRSTSHSSVIVGGRLIADH